ncbi:MAG: hypothetical protein EU541_04430 [Promethearchaeota archaeon]|nr:MAG: hypothetical protein EU541_04430 [Candidatus Lokiarchaeota archaeon]
MKPEEFIRQLVEAEDLIKEENYTEALKILSELRKEEQKEDFDPNLTHKLYQLISNAESLLNQSSLIEGLIELAQKNHSIAFKDLSEYFSKHKNINLKPAIIRREIELLILREKIPYKIKQNKLIFE